MQSLAIMNGDGVVRPADKHDEHKAVAVRYQLRILSDQALDSGRQKLTGWVEPPCFTDQLLTLETQTGQKLEFFFTSTDGAIAVNQWVE